MTYLGQGHRGSSLGPAQDELKVLQQVNGGENICVFSGLVSPGGTSYACKDFFSTLSNQFKQQMSIK